MQSKIKIQKLNKKNIKWTVTISSLAFFVSLFLSIMSESFLNGQSIIISSILLALFMILNVITDMIGLAISACQIESVKKLSSNEKILDISSSLILNADKVSSILGDVIGDICGILCGVSGASFSIILSNVLKLNSFKIIVASAISALIAGITVFLKAISKNYAINNSAKIVYKISKGISKLRKEK